MEAVDFATFCRPDLHLISAVLVFDLVLSHFIELVRELLNKGVSDVRDIFYNAPKDDSL